VPKDNKYNVAFNARLLLESCADKYHNGHHGDH